MKAFLKEAINTGLIIRGVTVFKGHGGRTDVEQDVLYCVVTRLEIGKVKNVTEEIDASAFVVAHALRDVEGGVIKKAMLH